ncbi:MAG: nucleotidyltransferase family protein [Bacteroidetes bacterium]|nr:nucleotidyltransferase family protein [Bacteroidota bacterium]
MKAMILAAGLGTRLRPLTDKIPKALVKTGQKTLLENVICHLKEYGIREIIVNVHHFADQVVDYLSENRNFGIEISISDETAQLLDTGGGLKKAAWFFTDDQPFIVYNVDVLSDFDLKQVTDVHNKSAALATLVVRERVTSRYLLFENGNKLCGWKNEATGEVRMSVTTTSEICPFAFSGIQVISPRIFSLITEEGKFSITDLYLRLAATEKIVGYIDQESIWKDLGKR